MMKSLLIMVSLAIHSAIAGKMKRGMEWGHFLVDKTAEPYISFYHTSRRGST